MSPSQIAAQLYTLRDQCRTAEDLARTAQGLRKIGYTAVQLSGVGPIPDDEIVRILSGEGLEICATHEGSAAILDEPERCVERLQRLGCTMTAYPFPKGIDFTSSAAVVKLVDQLARAGAIFHAAGLTLGYHNHGIEFLPYGQGTVLDHIYESTNPRHLVAELDTYWIHYGGGDVVEWCERMKDRLPFIHLKDYRFTPEDKPTFAEIGNGTLRWDRILPAAEASGCRWFIVEQDICPGDPLDSLAQSYHFLHSYCTA